jgi:hypothetical protein
MVDVKTLVPELDKLDTNETISEKEYYSQLASLMNKHTKFVLVYANNNKKIAQIEFLSVYNEDEYSYEMNAFFVFEDGSKVEASEYLNELDDLINEINEFIDTL